MKIGIVAIVTVFAAVAGAQTFPAQNFPGGSITPGAGRIPRADSTGHIDAGWLTGSVTFTDLTIGSTGTAGCFKPRGTDGITHTDVCATAAGTGLVLGNLTLTNPASAVTAAWPVASFSVAPSGTGGGTSAITATIAANTTDYNLMCVGYPGALLNAAGKTIRIVGYGDHNSGTGTPVTIYRLKVWTDSGCTAGAVTLFSFPANTVDITGLTNEGWAFDALLTTIATGSSGTLRPWGRMDVTFSNAANPQTRVSTSASDSTVNLTTATLYFSIVVSASSGSSATALSRQTVGGIYPVN